MTVWTARRAKHPDRRLDINGPRILCGRMVDGEYPCGEIIAWYAQLGSTDVVIPSGLTDDGTPGRYHWSRHALERMDRGEDSRSDRRTFDRSAEVGYIRVVSTPLTLPCASRHENAIDPGLLLR
jgi:hypothetical protein